jgi:hypothetical protein
MPSIVALLSLTPWDVQTHISVHIYCYTAQGDKASTASVTITRVICNDFANDTVNDIANDIFK